MNAQIAAARAVTSVYLRQLFFLPGVIVLALVALVILWSVYAIINLSPWWWLLLVPMLLLFLVLLVVRATFGLLLSRLQPRPLTAQETTQIKAFTEIVGRVADIRGASRLGILFRLIKDALVNRNVRYVTNLIDDSRSLKGDFSSIVDLFR